MSKTRVRLNVARGALSERRASRGALATDLDDRLGDVAILTMSEFGRMVRQNGNGGTDHGHGNAMLVIGGNVRGERVVGRWPGLGPDQLYEGRDLAVTTDLRDVFGEVVARHLGIADTSRIFPGYPIEASRFPGVFARHRVIPANEIRTGLRPVSDCGTSLSSSPLGRQADV